MKGNAKAIAAEFDEKREDDDIALIPVYINGDETLACLTVREARKRAVLALARTDEEENLSVDELKAHMKKQLCELLILERVLRPGGF